MKIDNKRLPRPYLLTEMISRYNKIEDDVPERMQIGLMINKHIVDNWSVNNGTIFGRYMSIEDLSFSLKIPVEFIHNHIRDKVSNIDIFNKDNMEDMSMKLVNLVLASSMDDRNAILTQVNILRQAQGNEYKAFISGELNKALKLQLESTNQQTNLIKSLYGGSSIVINNNNKGDEVNHITIDEINEQINIQMANVFNDKDKKLELTDRLYEQYSIQDVPEVRAIEQGDDIDTTSEGIESGLNSIELSKITDNLKVHLDTPEEKRARRRNKHSNRRALDEGLDIENV